MRQIVLTSLSPHILTSYIQGTAGSTRLRGNRIPTLSQLLTVGDTANNTFRASPATAAAIDDLCAAMMAAGMEPLRITDAFRSPDVQGRARAGYEAWLAAGKPSPHGSDWRSGMKTAYVAPPGGSNHGWGGAIDFDVAALAAPGVDRGSDGALELLWELARPLGFSPIISEPHADASEAWHLDHMGPLRAVRGLYNAAAREHSRYRGGYGHTARVGCALAGSLPSQTPQMFIQARLMIAGHWCGLVDGAIGPMTKAALAEADITAKAIKAGPHTIIEELNERKVGAAELRAA